VKTTGGRGLHVVVPLAPQLDWSECLEFSRRIAEALERRDPETYTTAFAKAGRERRILIDYLRNNRTNTSIAAFSTRALPAATVSTPLSWEELTPRLDPSRFTVETIPRRLARLKRDPWQDYWKLRQRIGRAAFKALEST
jgi:bifunctional non-homologous end joining protein LigD